LNNVANVRGQFRGAQKRDVSREVPLDAGAEQLEDGESTPSGRAITRERNDELELALARLPEHYREALRLRHQENCSFEETGRRPGRSAEAARRFGGGAVEELKHLLKPSHGSS